MRILPIPTAPRNQIPTRHLPAVPTLYVTPREIQLLFLIGICRVACRGAWFYNALLHSRNSFLEKEP